MPPVRQSNTTVHCKGFTILELLVVIAVIAVLAALSATAGATALRRARNARCQGNLKQQGVAMASYVGTKGHYPGVTNPEQVDLRTNAWLWPHTLEREMTGSDDHIPPRFKGGLKGSVWDCPGSDGDPDLSIDYGYNAWGITSALEQQPLGLGGKIRERSLVGEPETPRVPVSEGDVFRPSQMIALGDGVSGWHDGFLWNSILMARERPLVERRMLTPFHSSRHQSKVNVEFTDGHVESASLNQLFIEKSDQGLSVWNRDHRPHRERLLE